MSTQPLAIVPKVYTDPPMKSRRERLWLAAGKKCHWCGCPTRLVKDVGNWDCATVDHVIPRYKGGDPGEENCVSACARCNNRRNHEDMCGLAEGALLGSYKEGGNVISPNAGKSKIPARVLTRDDKKALMARMDAAKSSTITTETLLRQQRDQAMKRISELEKELTHCKTALSVVESMSIAQFIKKRIAEKLLKSLPGKG